MRRVLHLLAHGLGASILVSCLSEHTTRVVPAHDVLPWLDPNSTSLDLLVQHLGEPVNGMEGGRILLWEVDDDGRPTNRSQSGWHRSERPRVLGPHHLVAVLGEGGRVERLSLVRVWR